MMDIDGNRGIGPLFPVSNVGTSRLEVQVDNLFAQEYYSHVVCVAYPGHDAGDGVCTVC